jgi:hypothetical protein
MAIAKKTTKESARESRKESTQRYMKEHYREDFDQRIERPRLRSDFFQNQQNLVIIGLLLVIILGGAGFWFNAQSNKQATKAPVDLEQDLEMSWYAIKLSDGETVYGKIEDMKTDPITINPVYYNYDQVKDGAQKDQKINEAGDLRLVKRGQETHGPDGAMQVFKTQFVYMEKLKKESKVLQAILQNEQ